LLLTANETKAPEEEAMDDSKVVSLNKHSATDARKIAQLNKTIAPIGLRIIRVYGGYIISEGDGSRQTRKYEDRIDVTVALYEMIKKAYDRVQREKRVKKARAVE
jgi:hypothetical protein